MNAGATGRIGTTVRSIIRLDVAALLLALLAFAAGSAALDRNLADARGPVIAGQAVDDSGILPSTRTSAGDRAAQVEERLKRLELAGPSSSDGRSALAADPANSPDRCGPASPALPGRAVVSAGAADAFDARAPPRPV